MEKYIYDWTEEDWENRIGRARMESDFGVKLDESIHVLLAYYSYEDYSGEAFVLFEQGEKLYEVNGSHCSCYGLEGQWEPEETSPAAIRYRVTEGKLGRVHYSDNVTFTAEIEAALLEYEQLIKS